MHKNENTQNSHSFLALAFFRGICLSRHRRVWGRHGILRFLMPVLVVFGKKKKKKKCWVMVALSACFGCGCGRVHFRAFCGRWEVVFLPVSIVLRLIPIKFETLKPPSRHPIDHLPCKLVSLYSCKFSRARLIPSRIFSI
jgi:hypothetical protein